MSTIHAHVDMYSRDCDGTYTHDYITRPHGDEDEYVFRTRVMSFAVSVYADQMTVTITDGDISYYEHTEEGFRAGEVRYCREECVDGSRWSRYRDHAAEAAGY